MKTATSKLSRISLVAILCVTALPAHADQSITYTVKNVIVRAEPTAKVPGSSSRAGGSVSLNQKGTLTRLTPDGSKKKTTSSTSTIEQKVLLGKDQVAVDSNSGGKTIFDFAKKRILTIDSKKREYSDVDLYSYIFFKQAELQNRKMLNSITNSAGIKDVFKTFEDEMLFGLVMPGEHKSNSVKIDEHEGKVNYVHNGATVASYIPSKSALPESAKRGYGRFLTYNCPLHPEIRKSLLSQKMLPASLVFHFKDGPMSTTDCSYTLKSSEEVAAESASPPANYKQIQDKELSEIYAALAQLGPEPKLPDQNSVSAAVDIDLKNNNPLNAFLTVVEYSLLSGDQRPQDSARVVAKSNGNPDFQLFIKNLEPHSEVEAKAAVKALESINRLKLSKGYVIDIMAANIYVQLKDLPKAKKLFTRALVANPLNVGAYNDLGNLYISMWEPPTAWECFRIARKINPKHPMLKDIDELEHKLQTDFPDFF
jgi:hypothetical protein